jgi:glycosyltransferase involved in cell wall biosynthesis
MKIGIFDPYLDTLGGGEKYMLTAASCLAKDHDVSVLWDSDENVLDKAGKRFSLDLRKVKLAENIFKHESFLKRFILSSKYDAILFLSDGSIPFVKSKLFIHLQFPIEWVCPNGTWQNIKLKKIYKVICNSNFTKDFVDKKLGTKSIVLYPPSSVYFKNTKISKENIILTVGRFGFLPDGGYFKKQDFMIDTFKKMVDEGLKTWKLVIAISYIEKYKEELDNLKSLAKGYPIEFVENSSWEDLSKTYLKSKIYWHASGFGEDLKKNPERAEHFGISTVEAMSAKAVPIVISAGGQKEIVKSGENGFLWETQKDLIESTLKVINNSQLRISLSNKASKKAKDFSNEVFCENVRSIFKQ